MSAEEPRAGAEEGSAGVEAGPDVEPETGEDLGMEVEAEVGAGAATPGEVTAGEAPEVPAPGSAPSSHRPADDPPPPEPAWDAVPEGDDGLMNLVDHLDELRSRIILSLGTLFVTTVLCYAYSDRILKLLTSASPLQAFVFLDPAEAFFAHLKISCYAGLLLAAPVVIHQSWQFLRPALTIRERNATRVLFPVIVFFFALGVCFAFFGILPLGLGFLLGFATDDLKPMLSISSYATFVLWFLLVFGVTFELPVLIFVANRIGLVRARTLRHYRPHFIVGTVTVAAILTPPDVVSQIMLALPMWILFELTLVLIGFFPDSPSGGK